MTDSRPITTVLGVGANLRVPYANANSRKRAGLIAFGIAAYLIVQVVLALHALNTVPPQPKKLPEARAVGSGHVEIRAGDGFSLHPV
jgi:hypothetical protein